MKYIFTYSLFEAVDNFTIYNQHYSDINADVYNKIMTIQPKKRVYKDWLLNLYRQKKLKIEDLYKAEEYLQFFNRPNINKTFGGVGSLKAFDSIQSLFIAIKPLRDSIQSRTEFKEKVYEETFVHDFEKYTLHIPTTYKQSCQLGSGTEWCTANGKTDEHWLRYNTIGNLNILISKENTEKYQFFFPYHEFRDVDDISLNDQWWIENTEVLEYFSNRIGGDFTIHAKLLLGTSSVNDFQLFTKSYYIQNKPISYLRDSWLKIYNFLRDSELLNVAAVDDSSDVIFDTFWRAVLDLPDNEPISNKICNTIGLAECANDLDDMSAKSNIIVKQLLGNMLTKITLA